MSALPENVSDLFDKDGNLAVNLSAKKATPVAPTEKLPWMDEEPVGQPVLEVNMTRYFAANVALGVATVGLSAATAYLARKVRKQDEYLEAIREYTSRLINETRCGRQAYDTFLEDEGLEDTVNWANEREPVDEDDLAEKLEQ